MRWNPIALAIPGFFVAMAIEAWAARRAGRRVYRFADAISDLGCGVSQQVVALFGVVVVLGAYAGLHGRWRLFALEGATAWVAAFLGVDFLYYWWHRASHEVNVFWAAHVVHHQSEDFNLAVALRQSVLTQFTSLPFYLPLALLGVPPPVFATSVAFSTLYQFWIHSELIPKLGPFEWIFNTASHHRVHHAINPAYLDRNYGATLIVWDRLFGTFAPEREAPVYGTVTPLQSFDPLYAQAAYWLELGRRVREAPRLGHKLWLWLARPDWTPAGRKAAPEVTPATFRKFEVLVPPRRRALIVAELVVVAAGLLALLLLRERLPVLVVVAGAAAILFAVARWGAVLRRA